MGDVHQTGYDLHLTQYGDANDATFTGIAHSILGGSAWEPTAWGSVQVAAWGAMRRDAVGGAA
jgi:hypothetical protein